MGLRLDEFAVDSGELKGSAGLPILNSLKRNNMINNVIFVIRYFLGSKLGISVLIHAYWTTTEGEIKNANLKPWIEKKISQK